jgi:Tfp pilus assembly protein PilF
MGNHLAMATILENYGAWLCQSNRKAEAEALEARAKAICTKHAQQN